VAIAASDGAALAASYFPAAQRGPAMLLLHQCDMTRASWTPLATALAASGINVLAPDYRGYGGNRALDADYPKRGADADAALDWLLKQPTVDPRGVAVGGASCGVDHAVQLARRKDDVRALLLLSGGASSTGMTFLRAARIPVLLAYSVEEGGPLPAMREVVTASSHPSSVVRELSRAGHGAPMFDSDPTLLPFVVDWVVKALR
jgi:dienelactone hydrolase